MKRFLCLAACVTAWSASAQTEAVHPDVAARLPRAAPHPRLLWPAGGEQAVRSRMAHDPLGSNTYEAIRLCADGMLQRGPVTSQKQGRRLLHQSRRALGTVIHLGFMHRMTGDARYRDRAVREMQAAAEMPDWNPSHFLDTAEMTLALAIGYDWLHGALTAEERALIRTALEEKGLAPYLGSKSRPGWERGGNNWNQVCHAGMVGDAKDATVRWAMVTPGEVRADAGGAWLTCQGKKLRLDVEAATPVQVTEYAADPPPHDFDARNPGMRLAGFTAPVAAGKPTTWRVILTPAPVR